ncbi:MAG: nucleotidyltransferase domain-containing protein [Planctomycetes bacterium]|nr:nucleotidyltransferase domain-containing protein [Planctomycetota bacterium]
MEFPRRKDLERLARRHRVSLLLLFGSRAQGRARPGSDVDLAYLDADPKRPPDRLRLFGECADLFGTEALDLLDLRRCEPLAAYEAFRGGRLLYERIPGLHAARYSYAVRRYADTRKFRDGIDLYLDAAIARWRKRGVLGVAEGRPRRSVAGRSGRRRG